jgi:ribosomal protein L37E
MLYQGQPILMVSKHQKEQVIAPLVKQILQARLVVFNFDTDQFGTFTGEVPRAYPPHETCILKAKTCAFEVQQPFAIASEGSFGPHPQIPFLPYAHEIMVFVDLERDLVIAESLQTEKTNYASLDIMASSDISHFLEQVDFPKHKLCLQTKQGLVPIAKGIDSHQSLQKMLIQGFSLDTELRLSTDMRAMMNPTRMHSIGILAKKLLERINTLCPNCQTPGFGKTGTRDHLPCASCSLPSQTYALDVFSCSSCDFLEKKPRIDGKKNIDPQFCYYCNP